MTTPKRSRLRRILNYEVTSKRTIPETTAALERLRSGLFWGGFVVYIASFFAPGNPTPGAMPNIGATLFLQSLWYMVSSCAGLLCLTALSGHTSLGEAVTSVYLGPLCLVNVPVVATFVAWFYNRKPAGKWMVAALLFGTAYASFVPLLPGFLFTDIAIPYLTWICSMFLLTLYAMTSEYQIWMRRKWRRFYCETCGYNLTGNVSGKCPECGEACEPGERAT